MLDITSNNHGGSPASVVANARLEPMKLSLIQQVVALFQRYGNMTLDQVEERSGIKHQTISPRVSELRGDLEKVRRVGFGLLPTGEILPTRGGYDAEVLKLVPFLEWLGKANLYQRQMVSVKKFDTQVLVDELKSRNYPTLNL